jgi:hypothetical protein
MNNKIQTINTKAQQDAIDTAMKVIRGIDDLAGNENFRNFMKSFSKRSDALALTILHEDKLTHDERESLRNRRLGILEVLMQPSEDRAAQVGNLARFGIEL